VFCAITFEVKLVAKTETTTNRHTALIAKTFNSIFISTRHDLDEVTKLRLKKEHVTKEKIAKAPSRIKKICFDLVERYTKHIELNDYKGIIWTLD
jgi:hypothetical protein